MPKRGFLVSAVGLTLLLSLVLLNGCARLPREYPHPVSYALGQPQETRMGQRIADRVARHQGKSGFYLLESGTDAFMARILAIDRAQRTLDLQYYIFHDDTTGKFLLDHLVAAAERGVRIRILVDDWSHTPQRDWGLAMCQANPNIEVRVFNPFGLLRQFFLSRSLQIAFGARRLKGRMHNKAFIADNSVAIVGGRNIADEYFGARASYNFGDLDIMAIGPVTKEVSAVFDLYWNSELAIPISALVKRPPTAEDQEKIRSFLAANREAMKNTEYAKTLQETDLVQKVEARNVPYVWAEAEVLYDDPLKVEKPKASGEAVSMGQRLKTIADEAQSELLMISPYFIPGKAGMRWFQGLRDRGVTVKILTNSLASTDASLAEAGYARYRKNLLRMGVQLYELKPNPDQWRFWDHTGLGSSSKGSLHAKTVIIDRRLVFVGSFNFDPRSAKLDTQNGLVVRSRDLATQASRLFDAGISPTSAYRVELQDGSGLVWISEENGQEVRYFHDPMTDSWRRFSLRLLFVFTPESIL